ncbi:hypothetical protein BD310DRAFT_830466 [Dichomitus squalens]|uniref:Uncharacterized protein n=1 Tax=Dichomitus squalens TaxID=114155 RepID=A0A4Q9PHI4_9APHY|nr:hypothetical protein BD310DRAFT_830466 [Dichomitus squalens]
MRAYALSARKRRTRAIITFLLSVSPSIMALVLSPWIRFHHDPNNGGCSMAYDAPVLLQVASVLTDPSAVVSSRAFLVLADIIVVCITWSATYMHRLKSHGKPPSISDVLFRDGMNYDATLAPWSNDLAQLILNTIYLVSVLVPADVFGAKDLNSIASLYIQPATSILITHFLLDLQQASRRTMHLPAMNAGNWENMMGSVVLVPADVAEDSETDVADGPGP